MTLEATGTTLLGVFASIGITVAFGLAAPWWQRVAAGVATSALLVVGVGFLGRRTRLLKRLARWLVRHGR